MFIVGLLSGFVIFGILVYFFMPKFMIKTKQSKFDYQTTVSKIENNISEIGWHHKGTDSLSGAIESRTGSDIGANIGIIQLCKGKYAKAILQHSKLRFVSCIMPCTISVWEGKDGKVYISKMNTGLMGKMFGGIISDIMGRKVSKDEAKLLKGIEKTV